MNMKRAGLTFIELIVGIAILSVIMLAVYSIFNIGLKVWHRNQAERSLKDVRLAFLKIERELKKTFFFSAIPFKGAEKEFTFPLSVHEGDEQKLYSISYVIKKDPASGLSDLVRAERFFSGDSGEIAGGIKTRKALSQLRSARFQYAYRASGNTKGYEWVSFWDGEGQSKVPSGVRISIEIQGKAEVYNKVIFLQRGGLGAR